jgi:hypothetical protein
MLANCVQNTASTFLGIFADPKVMYIDVLGACVGKLDKISDFALSALITAFLSLASIILPASARPCSPPCKDI